MSSIPSDLVQRISTAADELYEESGREKIPTVDNVRRRAQSDMNATTSVMRTWRERIKNPPQMPIVIPEAVAQASTQALATTWKLAQEAAAESLRAAKTKWDDERSNLEQVSSELADAFERQERELEGARADYALALQEHKSQVDGLVSDLASARTEAADAERRAARAEIVTNETKVAHAALAEQLGSAKEEVARLNGVLETLKQQNETLIDALRTTVDTAKTQK